MLYRENDQELGSGRPALTKREVEVLRFVAEGKANKEISLYLRIAIKTVEAHRARIKRKLGVQTIAELVHCAIRMGIVKP